MKTCIFADPGHAWLAVPVSMLKELGIAWKISIYSYISTDGVTAYLEEDKDMTLFLDKMKEAGRPVEWEEVFHENSPIRGLPPFPAHQFVSEAQGRAAP